MDQSLKQALEWIEEIFEELHLPGVSKGSFMNRPSLRHRHKSIIGSKDGQVLVVHCPLDTKERLLEDQPDVYFQTEHYEDYPALLIRPEMVDKTTLKKRIEEAWRMNATKQQLSQYIYIELALRLQSLPTTAFGRER